MVVINLYSGININDLKLLGTGTQGKVYRINNEKCIKVFKDKKECSEELTTLVMAQGNIHFPKLYDYGKNYIIRECINGITLDEFLKSIEPSPIFDKLIELYEAMLEIGYKRLDAAIFHIFVASEGELKLIDTAKAMRKKTQIPNLLISGIDKLGYKEALFSFLRSNRPDLYSLWKNYIKIDYKKKG